MSSQLNAFLATSRGTDLHRSATRSRCVSDPDETVANAFATMLRSRRLGRLFRFVPAPPL